MKRLPKLMAQAGFSARETDRGELLWVSIDTDAMRIELAVWEEADHLRLLFSFGEQPVDTTPELCEYYLQLNSDMSLFRLFLRPDDRLCLTGCYPLADLEVGGLQWLLNEFAQSCAYLHPDLAAV